ncbi:MAG: hypothetical protein Q9187_004779 [Circinaria calcarea]
MEFKIHYSPKDIYCILASPSTQSIGSANDETGEREKLAKPALIFTHGAGGSLTSGGIANFSCGFSSLLPILCFQGNMNLKSRVKMFNAIVEDQNCSTWLGGRSMGARAAVMATTSDTTHLVLVSYPLHTAKEVRDQILLHLPESIKVVFVSGDGDSMCSLDSLEQVRGKMKCKSWRIVVKAADHGLEVKPRTATEAVGKLVGEVVARWLGDNNDTSREGQITWNAEAGKAEWSGWASKQNNESLPKDTVLASPVSTFSELPISTPPKKNILKRKERPLSVDRDAVSTRTRKHGKS